MTADLLAKCDEDFFGRVVLVGEGDKYALLISWRDRSQREHVPADDILLDLRDLEITVGIFSGDLRMMKTVKFVQLDLVPVVKKIVVEKSASYELFLLKAEREDHGPEQGSLGYSDTMVIAGAFAVLLKFLEFIEMTGL